MSLTPKATVLGSRRGTGNIGEAVVDCLHEHDWEVVASDCLTGEVPYRLYSVPEIDMHDSGALVVTLGATSKVPFDRLEQDQIGNIVHACLTLPLKCVQEYVKQRAKRGGHIVLVGSYAHRHPFTAGTPYCAAKAGLEMAGKTLAWELTELGYIINVVHPYHVQGTPMWEKVQAGVMDTYGMSREEADSYAMKDAKTRRLMYAPEVADQIVRILENEDAIWMSGSSIELFGGTR